MRGIFRVTRAEFNKIFKKPTVYIMALVLVFACLLSLFTFSPTNREDERVKYTNASAQTIHASFFSANGNDNKASYDSVITKTNQQIEKIERLSYLEKTPVTYKHSINYLFELISNDTATPTQIDDFKNMVLKFAEFFDINDQTNIANSEEYLKKVFNSCKVEVDFTNNLLTQTTDNYIIILQNQVLDIYNNIKDETKTSIIKNKCISNNYISTLNSTLDTYSNLVEYTLDCIVDDIENIETVFKNYYIKNSGVSNKPASNKNGKMILNMLSTKLTEYKEITDLIVKKESGVATIKTENRTKLNEVLKRILEMVDTSQITNTDNNDKLLEVATKLNSDNYLKQLRAYNDLLKYVDYSDETLLSDLNKIKSTLDKNQNAIIEKIDNLQNDVSTAKISNEITSYKLMTTTYSTLIDDKITKHIISNINNSAITQLYDYDLENYNEYNLNNDITYNTYYLNTNTYSNSYLNTFEYGTNSGYTTNAYDYIYSTLKICTLLIIVFTMMMSAYLISSENDSGTIKLLLMRPYKRSKILLAKMLATLFFSLTFLLLAIIITAVGGVVSFGLPTMSTMLLSFNSTKIFTTTPLVAMLIYIASIILDIIFFLVLAYFVAIVFKSFAGTVSVSFISVLLIVILNISLSNSIVYKFIPFTNISLFRFFGRNTGVAQGFLNTLLSTPIQSNMTIWLSLIITTLFTTLLYIITMTIFKKRDY